MDTWRLVDLGVCWFFFNSFVFGFFPPFWGAMHLRFFGPLGPDMSFVWTLCGFVF